MVATESTFWAARETPGTVPPSQLVQRLVDVKWGPPHVAPPVRSARVLCAGADHVLELTSGGRMSPPHHPGSDQACVCTVVTDAWNRSFPAGAPKLLKDVDLIRYVEWVDDTEDGRAARVALKEETCAALVDAQIANNVSALERTSGGWGSPKRALHRLRLRTLRRDRHAPGGRAPEHPDRDLDPLAGLVIVARHVDDDAWRWFASRWRPKRPRLL